MRTQQFTGRLAVGDNNDDDEDNGPAPVCGHDDDAAAADDDDAAAAGDDDRLALGMKAPNPLPGSSSSFSRACSRLLAISSPIRFIPPHAKANGTPTPIIAA